MVRVIILDTETTGLPKTRQSALDTSECWPDLVSFSWSVFVDGAKQSQHTYVIKPDGWTIPAESTRIHGITHEQALRDGVSLRDAMDAFKAALRTGGDATSSPTPVRVVAHNLSFDKNVLFHAWKWRLHDDPTAIWKCDEVCTMRKSEGELKLERPNSKGSFGGGGGFKWPSLAELWVDTFHSDPPAQAHSADRDVRALEQICLSRWKGLFAP